MRNRLPNRQTEKEGSIYCKDYEDNLNIYDRSLSFIRRKYEEWFENGLRWHPKPIGFFQEISGVSDEQYHDYFNHLPFFPEPITITEVSAQNLQTADKYADGHNHG
jgi:hypothetical protein